MFESIYGCLIAVLNSDSYIVVRDGGIGYRIYTSKSFAKSLFPKVGEIVEISLHEVIYETKRVLYGFYSEEDRKVFLQLIGVPGVGASTAISIMDIGIVELCAAINSGDERTIVAIKGIGPKTAKQIISDLKGKMPDYGPGTGVSIELIRDATKALGSLGHKSNIAKKMVDMAVVEHQISDLKDLITKSLLYNGKF